MEEEPFNGDRKGIGKIEPERSPFRFEKILGEHI